MKIRTYGLTALAAAGICSAASAGFEGQMMSINTGRLGTFPDAGTVDPIAPGLDTITSVVGPNLEASGIGLFDGFSADVSDQLIVISWDPAVGAISISGPGASGRDAMWFLDANDSIPEIASVTLMDNRLMPSGVSQEDITFTADSIYFDLSSTGWTTDRNTAVLAVTFVPAPGAAGVAGLVLLAGVRRRR